MGPSKASSGTAVRTAAVTVGLALLLIGPAACGSGSSSDSAQQTSTAAKKKAGLYRGVRLEVKNASASSTILQLCGDGQCQARALTLKPGASEAMAASEITGGFSCYSCSQVYFKGVNPSVGAPYVAIQGSDGDGHGDAEGWRKLAPDEGASGNVDIQGQSFTVTRRADSPDYKMFELTLN
jgi:hypothetical protein